MPFAVAARCLSNGNKDAGYEYATPDSLFEAVKLSLPSSIRGGSEYIHSNVTFQQIFIEMDKIIHQPVTGFIATFAPAFTLNRSYLW